MKNLTRSEAKRLTRTYAYKISEIMRINDVNQSELALVLNTSSQNVNRWLNKKQLPGPAFREKIDYHYADAKRIEEARKGPQAPGEANGTET